MVPQMPSETGFSKTQILWYWGSRESKRNVSPCPMCHLKKCNLVWSPIQWNNHKMSFHIHMKERWGKKKKEREGGREGRKKRGRKEGRREGGRVSCDQGLNQSAHGTPLTTMIGSGMSTWPSQGQCLHKRPSTRLWTDSLFPVGNEGGGRWPTSQQKGQKLE